MRYVALALVLATLGCVKVPPQTAVLSAKLGNEIAQDKRNDSDLLDWGFKLAKDAAYEQMKYYWIPRIIKEMLAGENDDGKTFDQAVCQEEGKMDRAIEIQSFVKALNAVVRAKERELINPIRKEERQVKKGFRVQHDLMERMSGAITNSLQAVIKEQEIRSQALKALNLPTDAMTPIRKATKKINKFVEED